MGFLVWVKLQEEIRKKETVPNTQQVGINLKVLKRSFNLNIILDYLYLCLPLKLPNI